MSPWFSYSLAHLFPSKVQRFVYGQDGDGTDSPEIASHEVHGTEEITPFQKVNIVYRKGAIRAEYNANSKQNLKRTFVM